MNYYTGIIIYSYKSADYKHAAVWIFTNRTNPCSWHPDQETEHSQDATSPWTSSCYYLSPSQRSPWHWLPNVIHHFCLFLSSIEWNHSWCTVLCLASFTSSMTATVLLFHVERADPFHHGIVFYWFVDLVHLSLSSGFIAASHWSINLHSPNDLLDWASLPKLAGYLEILFYDCPWKTFCPFSIGVFPFPYIFWIGVPVFLLVLSIANICSHFVM